MTSILTPKYSLALYGYWDATPILVTILKVETGYHIRLYRLIMDLFIILEVDTMVVSVILTHSPISDHFYKG